MLDAWSSAVLSIVEPALNGRWFVQVMLLSLGLTVACQWGFRDDARSRRSLGVAAIWMLLTVPLVLLLAQPRYQIGMLNPPTLPTLPGLPSNALLSLLVLWLAWGGWGSLQLARRVQLLTRNLRELPDLADPTTIAEAAGFGRRLGLAMPRLVVGERCCASTLGEARVVVPSDFASWPTLARQSVVAHELVHIKRRDDRFMLLLQALLRWYPFLPWLGLLYLRFVHSLEEACDERAAELVGGRGNYREGLAEAALRMGGRVSPADRPLAVALIDSPAPGSAEARAGNSLMLRLARLIEEQRYFEVQSGSLAAGVAGGLLTLSILTTFELAEVAPHRQGLERVLPTNPIDAQAANASTLPEVRVISQAIDRDERVSPAVIYPGRALLAGIEGEVLVEFSIAADGTPVRARVIRSTHPEYFDATATRAVRQALYAPAYATGISGVSAAPRVQKLFVFRLNGTYASSL